MIKWRRVVGLALVVGLVGSASLALAQDTAPNINPSDVKGLRELNLELVGQVQNSAPGVSPATSIQYGYLSYLHGLPIFRGEPPSESTGLATFYTDTTTTQLVNDGPLRVIDRKGKLTIYYDSTPDGNFANPDSFRDGTSALVADVHQQVIVDTATGAFTAENVNTITSTRAFEGPTGALQLGKTGDRFRTLISGRLNAPPGPPSAFMAGYANSISGQTAS
jgi:hypothetical protein